MTPRLFHDAPADGVASHMISVAPLLGSNFLSFGRRRNRADDCPPTRTDTKRLLWKLSAVPYCWKADPHPQIGCTIRGGSDKRNPAPVRRDRETVQNERCGGWCQQRETKRLSLRRRRHLPTRKAQPRNQSEQHCSERPANSSKFPRLRNDNFCNRACFSSPLQFVTKISDALPTIARILSQAAQHNMLNRR